MDTTRPADDPGNFQRDTATGQTVLEENHVYDANCQYVAGGIRFQIQCQAEYDVKLDGNNRPISLTRREPRLFQGQHSILEHTGFKPRQLCPTLIQIRRYFAREPLANRPADSQSRGRRTEISAQRFSAAMPTGGVFETLFIDTFRLPITASIHEEHDATAQELLRPPSLMGGARRPAPARLKGYRWVFVGIDGTSKWCFVKEISQKSPLDVGKTTATGDDDSVGASSGRLHRAMSVSSNHEAKQQHGNDDAAPGARTRLKLRLDAGPSQVMRRYNTATHSAIKLTPSKRSIVDAGKRRLEGVRHHSPLLSHLAAGS